jgi:hypothetical protein
VNYTDNSASIPERYRKKPIAETTAQSAVRTAQVRPGRDPQDRLDAIRETRAADHLANLEQHRRSAEAQKQRQADARELETTLQSLTMFIVIGIIIGICLLGCWAATIVTIARSEFMAPSGKTVWLLVVIFLPLFGMLIYMVLGTTDRSRGSAGCREKRQSGAILHAR